MTHTLKLNNEQAQALFILLASKTLNGVKNRVRWKFLNVIEDTVIEYEGSLRALRTKHKLDDSVTVKSIEDDGSVSSLNEELKQISVVEKEYEFNDREVFAQAKEIFRSIGEEDALKDRLSKMYFEIEDALMNAKETDAPQP